jgi:hypothetical protein
MAAEHSLDPACFASVPWLNRPQVVPIRVFGCRPVAKIPRPDKAGWITYINPRYKRWDGGYTKARLDRISSTGVWSFDIEVNGGGSGTFPYHVTGKPDANGVLLTRGLRIDVVPIRNRGDAYKS